MLAFRTVIHKPVTCCSSKSNHGAGSPTTSTWPRHLTIHKVPQRRDEVAFGTMAEKRLSEQGHRLFMQLQVTEVSHVIMEPREGVL